MLEFDDVGDSELSADHSLLIVHKLVFLHNTDDDDDDDAESCQIFQAEQEVQWLSDGYRSRDEFEGVAEAVVVVLSL